MKNNKYKVEIIKNYKNQEVISIHNIQTNWKTPIVLTLENIEKLLNLKT